MAKKLHPKPKPKPKKPARHPKRPRNYAATEATLINIRKLKAGLADLTTRVEELEAVQEALHGTGPTIPPSRPSSV